LRPFAACVFNDNGDITCDTSHLRTADYRAAAKALAAIDALAPAGGVGGLPSVTWWNGAKGPATNLADSLDAYARVRPGGDRDTWAMRAAARWIREVTALAPQNAGGERQQDDNPHRERQCRYCGKSHDLFEWCKEAHDAEAGITSEATPAPAKCGCGEFCQDLGVDSGCRYISNPPAPADDAAVAWRFRAKNEPWTVSDFKPFADWKYIEPLFTRPAKAVDVEAIKRAISDHIEYGYERANSRSETIFGIDEAAETVLALLSDSNASSDKGGR
jgi:hypothetical protein